MTLPWGFEQSGAVLGLIVLAIFAFYAILSTFFRLEALDRGQRWVQRPHPESEIELNMFSRQKGYVAIDSTSSHSNVDGHILSSNNRRALPTSDETAETDSPIHNIHQTSIDIESTTTDSNTSPTLRKLEITELCGIFLGPLGERTYTITIAMYMYGTLWAYTTVFANAFATHLSIADGENTSYYIYILTFAAIVVPVSIMEFSEQVIVQVSLAIFRIVMVSLMVLTALLAYSRQDHEFGDVDNTSKTHEDVLQKWNFRKLYLLLPIAAYAYIFHHSVPSLAYSTKDQIHLTHLFRTALVISMLAYMLVGTVVSMYFGEGTLTSSNLNWQYYIGLRNRANYRNDSNVDIPWYADVISFFIVLFPAIDVASAYPLNAYTLGNNLMSAYYGKEMYKHDRSRWKLTFFRLIAAVPPIFGAFFVSDLGRITDVTGLAAFGIAFIFPPLLARQSKLLLDNYQLEIHTPHSSYLLNHTACEG